MKARKKPVEIDFFDFDNDIPDVEYWVASFNDSFYNNFFIDDEYGLHVKTLEGTSYTIVHDDMIIRGIDGEYYPCKKDIFYKTYDII